MISSAVKAVLPWVAGLAILFAAAFWFVRVANRGGFSEGGFGGTPTRTGLEP